MAIPSETPLLEPSTTGLTVARPSAGGWKPARFIIGAEAAERFAFFGIVSNLISYLTGPIREPTAAAAANVNAWTGTSMLLPVLGAFVADAFLGRYRTIVIASGIYMLGLGLLTLSASLISPKFHDGFSTGSDSSSSSGSLQGLLFLSLYLVAVGEGGHRPCVQAFGADQFNGDDPEERKSRSSFFNWWFLCSSVGINLAILVVVYVQENINWALGFGIPCVSMATSLAVFLLGTRSYRYPVEREEKNPFARIGLVFVAAVRNRKCAIPKIIEEEAEAHISQDSQQTPRQFKFLDKALLNPDDAVESGKQCSFRDVQEAKALLRLVHIWTTNLTYTIATAQYRTFFTKQGATMDRKVTRGIEIPAASLQLFVGASIIVFVPVYDRIFVPIARTITREPSGVTMLQRVGTGMVLMVFTMAIAALVETKRLETAKDHGLIDQPDATVPMSLWWLAPQFLLLGLADVFTVVGQQEFFYSQVPAELRSVGMSLFLTVIGVGNFLSSFLISVTDKATGGSWFDDNMNRAHINYFYWLLSGISALGFAFFLYFSKSYVYNRGCSTSN